MNIWEFAEARPSIQAAYDAWRATLDGELVYENVRARAENLLRRGWRHFGIRPLWEAARYDRALVVGPDADGYKINDHYHSRMARELLAKGDVPEGFFELRELKS